MATKKSSNTTKTAHVMNLLSKNGAEPAQETEEAVKKAPPVEAEPPAQTLISSMNADSELASQIKSALEDSLDPAPAEETAPEPAAEPESVAAPEPEPVAAHEPAQSAEAPAPEILAASEALEPAAPRADPTTYVNVMQALVEERANKYIDMFGLCTCARCLADVKAIALNNLPPKYVVMRAGEMVPRITVYEGQFSADVTAQILHACKLVLEHPRHDSP